MKEKIIRLRKNEVSLIAKGKKGTTLTCVSGMLWITCGDCTADLALSPEKRMSLYGRSKICIQALEDSECRIYDNNSSAAGIKMRNSQ